MDWFSWSVNILLFVNLVLAIFLIFNERRDAGSTWAWLLILFFLPIIGFLLYLFLGRQMKQENFYRLTREEQAYHSGHIHTQLMQLDSPDNKAKLKIHTSSKYDSLAAMNLRGSKALLSFHNRISLLHDGNQKFNKMMEDMQQARTEINIQYFIIKRDPLGRKLLDILTEKAREGVKVRILYDGIGSMHLKSSDFEELASYKGEVRVFFPSLFKYINLRINNRNHRKLCVIDGKIGYIGGFNVGTEYLGEAEKFGYWRDTHLRLEGDAVYQIQERFIMDWHYAGSGRPDPEEWFEFAPHAIEDTAAVQIVASGPNSRTEHLKNAMIHMILRAEHRIYIQTPYFIPDQSFIDACKMALLSGVELHIMIPGKKDHPFVMWASWSFLGELLDYGAQAYLYDGGFLHAKTLVIDGEASTVGTTNLDARSFRLNFEVNAIVYNNKLALELESLFETDAAQCRMLTKDIYNRRAWHIKAREGFARLLSPIL
ncbi:cardiolipin synthase [Sinobaca qinghaiensis]|uniref:Cardiolipin synthase n=1 Tax=Sinobaca qinghaiensis TaxID=342944 RepID=A0A419V013_9BACL|nr:cardiolipin synthase [Sinobaca qinghaiensis]RKD71306.1 cardiolipin synthase [Sinobaca qinghaiensis]